MWGWALKPSLAVSPARSIMRAKPAVVKGEPRSLVKTNGEDPAEVEGMARDLGWISSPPLAPEESEAR